MLPHEISCLHQAQTRFVTILQARTREGGGALGARAPPTWEKSSAQKCPKEERKFRPDMSAKKNMHVPLRYHKKEEISKRKGLKLKK